MEPHPDPNRQSPAGQEDLLRQRQTMLLRRLLLVLLAGSILSLPVNLFISGPLPMRLLLATAHLLVIILSLMAFWYVRQGYTAGAALLAAFGLVVGLAAVIVASGLHNSPVPVFGLALPLTLVSLLASRRSLAFVTLACALVVVGAVVLESSAPSMAGVIPAASLPLPFIAVSFLVILGTLALFLDGFGVALQRTVNALTTANRRLEGELVRRKQLESDLVRIQRLESIGLLAAGVAHDFNNALTAIRGYTEFAMERMAPGDPARSDLQETLHAADRAASMTRQLLAFARRQVLEPSVHDLNTLIQAVERMLRRLIGAHIELVVQLDPQLWPVFIDPGQIEQVIVNLAINARDAMPDGGTLLIETRNTSLDETHVDRRVEIIPGDYVLMTISDTGIGMDAEVQKRAFDPFFTTKEPGYGSGLGLATCYGIIGQHDGYIWLYSEPGHGTTLKIYLPRAAGPVEPVVRDTRYGAMPQGSEVVLVVEDEDAVRALMVRLLRSLGYQVIEASNGTEALQLLTDQPMRIDLVLTDLVMPRMGGRSLVEQLQGAGHTTRVLYTTGYTDNTALRTGTLSTQSALLQKPFTPGALARKVRETLDARP